MPEAISIPTGRPFHAITLDTPCGTCSATGIVQSELWREWAERDKRGELHTDVSLNALCARCSAPAIWLSRDGVSYGPGSITVPEKRPIVPVALCHRHATPGEPEELPCDECDGSGFVPTAAGLAILAFLARHRGRG